MPIQEFEYPEEILRARGLLDNEGTQAQLQGDSQPLEPEQAPTKVEERPPEVNRGDRPQPKISPELQKHIQQQLAAAQLPPNTIEEVVPEGPTKPLPAPRYTPRKVNEGTSADLPSKFAFYDFTDLFIGKFKTRHYGKLHESHITHSLELLIECVSDILSTSLPSYSDKPLGFYLTIPDFYWVLYYLRLNQTKVALTHNTVCDNPAHREMVQQEKLPKESLKITQAVTRSQIHTRVLAAAPDMSQFEFENFTLAPARMLDVVESMQFPEYTNDADFRYLCRVASMIRPKDQPDAPMEVRLALVEDLEFEDLRRIGHYEQMVTSYGPDEFINVTCKECGHQRKTKITLDARSFLPLQ